MHGCKSYRKTSRPRRDFIRVGSLGGIGICLADVLRSQSAHADQKWYESKVGSAKRVIPIVCGGGIAAQESWNSKPAAPLEYRQLGKYQT